MSVTVQPGTRTTRSRRAWSGWRRLARIDLGVLAPTLALLCLSIFAQGAAGEDGAAVLGRQMVWIALGIPTLIVAALIPYTQITRHAIVLYLLSMAALVIVMRFGVIVSGARRWFQLGSIAIQPSEFAKVATILVLARWARFGERVERFGQVFAALALAGLPALLVVQQPDLGTSLLFVPIALALIFVGGLPWRRFLALLLALVALAGVAYQYGLQEYQRERIFSALFHDRLTTTQRWGSGYQLTQSLLRVTQGGFRGLSPEEQERVLHDGLPHAHNDFVFVAVVARYGSLGGVLVLGVIALLVTGLLRLGLRARDPVGRALCVGLGTLLACQSLVHVAVGLGLAPTTGMPLPLISYGGSSLLTNMACLGLALSVGVNPPRRHLGPR